jgi:hypothetical protein
MAVCVQRWRDEMDDVMIPEILDDKGLSNLVNGRPDWNALAEAVKDVDGKQLAHMDEFGAAVAQQLHDEDTVLKKYLPAFLKAYWESPFGKVETAGADFADRIRLPEQKRIEDARSARADILSAYELERQRLIEAERLRKEAEQRRIAEEEKERQIADLAARSEVCSDEEKEEVEQQIAQLEAELVIPVAVSTAQASVNLPATPMGLSASRKKVYERRITDLRAFLNWLVAHHHFIGMVGIQINFTAIKHSPVVMDGVEIVREKLSVSNRSK